MNKKFVQQTFKIAVDFFLLDIIDKYIMYLSTNPHIDTLHNYHLMKRDTHKTK